MNNVSKRNKYSSPRSRANREAAAIHNAGKGAQVDQDVDQRVLVGDSLSMADHGPLDAEFPGPGVDPFGGHALLVDVLVDIIVALDRVFEEP